GNDFERAVLSNGSDMSELSNVIADVNRQEVYSAADARADERLFELGLCGAQRTKCDFYLSIGAGSSRGALTLKRRFCGSDTCLKRGEASARGRECAQFARFDVCAGPARRLGEIIAKSNRLFDYGISFRQECLGVGCSRAREMFTPRVHIEGNLLAF